MSALLRLGSCASAGRIGKIIKRQMNSAATPAQKIDELVPGNRKHPGSHRGAADPTLAFEMNGEQCLLHDILCIGFRGHGAGKRPPDKAAQCGGQRGQQALIGRAIALIGSLQQQRPFSVRAFAQASLDLYVAMMRVVTCLLERILSRFRDRFRSQGL